MGAIVFHPSFLVRIGKGNIVLDSGHICLHSFCFEPIARVLIQYGDLSLTHVQSFLVTDPSDLCVAHLTQGPNMTFKRF